MSGGHWGYLSHEMERNGERASQAVLLLAAIEHELDWGHSGDTCLACARLRTIAAIEHWFDDGASDAYAAISIARDYQQNVCPDDAARRLAVR